MPLACVIGPRWRICLHQLPFLRPGEAIHASKIANRGWPCKQDRLLLAGASGTRKRPDGVPGQDWKTWPPRTVTGIDGSGLGAGPPSTLPVVAE